MLFDRAKGKYDVTYCSIFDPRDPRNVGGCVFCQDAEFEIVEPLFSRCKLVPGSKCNEEWWCHVPFTAKPKSADCSDVALEHFFGELSRDSRTREYNATYCEIFKPTVRRITHGCLICPPLEKHPFDGFSAGRPPHPVAAKRLLKYLDEGVDSFEAKRNRVEKNHVCGVQSRVGPPYGPRVLPWMIYSTERVHGQNQVKESRRLCFNPAHFSTDRKYAEIAIKSYAKRKDVEYGILDVLFAYRKSLSLPKYEDVKEWCHVSFIAKPKNKDGRPKHYFAEMVVDPISRIRQVIRCCTFKPRGCW